MRSLKQIGYAFHVIVRPFDGFYDLKSEKKGNVPCATLILAAALLTWLFSRQYAGYFFSTYDPYTYNVLIETVTFLLPFFLWVVANWALTTLMDGKGTMKDVYIATSYALTPLILILPPLIAVSNVLSLEEGSYYLFFYSLSFVWTGFLIFAGTMMTHQYLVGKTVITCILTIAAMAVIVFIALLFYSLIQKLVIFVLNSYNELRFRFY